MNTITEAAIRWVVQKSKKSDGGDGEGGAGALQGLDDRALLDLVLGRSDAAWRELVQRFDGPVRGTLFAVLKRYASILDSEARDELVQDFYLRLLDEDMRRLRMFDAERGRLSTFLRRVAQNLALDFVRKEWGRPVNVDLDALLAQERQAPEENEASEGFAPDRPPYEVVDAHLWWLERLARRKAERNARGVR